MLAVSVDALTTYYSAAAKEYERLWASALETDLTGPARSRLGFTKRHRNAPALSSSAVIGVMGPPGTPSHAAWSRPGGRLPGSLRSPCRRSEPKCT